MNNKLLIGVLIVILFIFILIVPHYKNKENFTVYKYPNKLISNHIDFINSNSNQYSNIFSLFDSISNEVFNLYEQDEDKKITKEVISQSIYNIVYTNLRNISNSVTCSKTNKSEKCKMFIILIQYFENEVSGLTKGTPKIEDIIDMDLINNDTDIENKLNFSKINKILENLYTKTITTNIDSFTIIRKELIVKKLVKNILFNIYFTIYPSSVGGLACPLYTADTCPSVPYQSNTDENSPTLPSNLEDKYKCAIDSSVPASMSNLCINNSNNKFITKHCEIMNGYGKIMCENTEYEKDDGTTDPCKFENLTQRCVNSNTSDSEYLNTSINSDNEYSEKSDLTGEKCHLIYHNDLDEMKKICESQKSKCEFHEITDEDSKKYGVCMAKNESERPNNFCLELSNIDKNFSESKGCYILQKPGFFYSTKDPETYNKHREEKLACHLFDSSNEMVEDGSSSQTNKEEEDMAYVKGSKNQKILCEGLKTDLGERKCQYIEYQKYIPNDHNSKYSKIGMCVPKNAINVEAELIKNKEDCHSDFYWSDENKLCLDLNAKCQNFKHKGMCNLYDNCLWSASDTNSRIVNDYENGYCRDISSSLQRVEDLIDNIHQSHLENAVELTGIEEKVSNMIPKFKNLLTSN